MMEFLSASTLFKASKWTFPALLTGGCDKKDEKKFAE